MDKIIWHSKHELFHIVLGFLWITVVIQLYGPVPFSWFLIAACASVFPDLEHIYYFLTYGKNNPYSRHIKYLFKKRQWQKLTVALELGHKKNTHLMFHNAYTIFFLLCCLVLAINIDLRLMVVILGSMLTHFLYDIIEDIVLLGKLNPNWYRWGRA